MSRSALAAAARRVALLALLTILAASSTWGLAADGHQAAPPNAGVDVGVTARERSAAAARAAGPGAPVPVSVAIGGQRTHLSVAGWTVSDVVAALGLTLGPGDRLSLPLDAPLVAGLRLSIDRGVPVTVVDGGRMIDLRAARGSVAGFLAAAGIAMAAEDRLEGAADAQIEPGTVIRIHRVVEREVSEQVPLPFGVRYLSDPTLAYGHVSVADQGRPGLALRVHRVSYVNGSEARRVFVSETVLREPVVEVRIRGTRPPPAPAEIDEIIRAAASRWGADPEQLLRVAWCESRFRPDAYNPSHGDSGLFQFIPATWARNSPRAGYDGASPFDAVASANTAAMLFAEGKASLWTCK